MKIKVCGMRQADNIAAAAKLDIDLMGFIFYPKSLRCVNDMVVATASHIGRVGVFVDSPLESVVCLAEQNQLSHLQLHGAEPAEYCLELKKRGFVIIKAFQIENKESFDQCSEYSDSVDLLLFDTASANYGGSGKSFDWRWLSSYRGDQQYILSGGISFEMVDEISRIKDPRLWGVDLNSRFEIEPALKDIDLLTKFINQLKHQ